MCGKGICFKVSYEERTNLSTFVIYNSQCMEKFVEEYHEVISNAQGRRRGGKSSKTEPLSILGWLDYLPESRGNRPRIQGTVQRPHRCSYS